jgi:deoxyribodipyrimidine photo-lyase
MTTSHKTKTVNIHIFRRDYRLYDNTSLIEACKTHDIVIPIFIFTHKQIDPKQNTFRSDNCLQFLCESIFDLDKQIKHITSNNSKLYIFYGDEFVILTDIIKLVSNNDNVLLKSISFNMDYTAYSQQRDDQIKKLCEKNNIQCINLDDICLNPIGTVLNGSGNPYTKYTPFMRASASKDIRKTVNNTYKNYLEYDKIIGNKLIKYKYAIDIDDVMKPGKIMPAKLNDKLPEHGGRENGLAILKNLKTWSNYDDKRDQLTYQTTHLSPFNKFGCVSVREVYWAMVSKLGKNNGVIRQLIWRDFFYYLSYYNNKLLYSETALNPKYRNIHWEVDNNKLMAWKTGNTGFPIVDACMRELNETGYMHNRGRLIVSSFLCRLLHIDWKHGEKYFANKLYDYDPAQNNFGWQVSGSNSSGTTSRPLEQTILNPWLQGWQFDRKGEYIKKWCPELVNVESSDLHKWNITCDEWLAKGIKYIKPIVDYKTEKEKNLKLYRKYM